MLASDTMISSNPEPTRFRQKSATSAQSRPEFLSHFYSSPTDAHLPTSSPARFYLRSLRDQGIFTTNLGRTYHCFQENNGPSPPLADTPLGGSVSLSPLTSLDSVRSNFVPRGVRTHCFGGILDSPLVMYAETLRPTAPLSPPPTLPITSSSLPHAENDPYVFSPGEAHDLDQDEPSDSQWAHFDALTPSSQSSCSSLQSPPPLSPISPHPTEWIPHGFSFPPVSSPPYRDAHAFSYDGIAYHDSDGNFPHNQRLDELTSPKHPPSSLLCVQQPHYSNTYFPGYFISHEICESPQPIPEDLEPIEFEDTPFFPQPFGSFDQESDIRGSDVELVRDETCGEFLVELEPKLEAQAPETLYPHAPFPPTSSPAVRATSLPEYDDLEMDVDLPDFFNNPPSSPSRRSYSALPDDANDLESPDVLPPYPGSGGDTSSDTIMLSPPNSPGLTFLALPGADTDEELIPMDLGLTKSPPNDNHRSLSPYPMSAHPLLVVDDATPQQSLHQRSPSPEPCALYDMSLLTPQIPEADEELRKMCGLLKRARDKEKAAKQMESIVEDEERVARSIGGPGGKGVADAWDRLVDARRKTRKMKDRVREIATLLRLKLAQRGWKIGKDESGAPNLVPLSPDSRVTGNVSVSQEDEDGMRVDAQKPRVVGQKRQRITNPGQLLVKMIMDRHEPKYNPNLRAGLTPKRKSQSPLAKRSISASEVEVGSGDHDMSDVFENSNTTPVSDVVVGGADKHEERDLDGLDLGLDNLQIPS